jgi:hypothetical protein
MNDLRHVRNLPAKLKMETASGTFAISGELCIQDVQPQPRCQSHIRARMFLEGMYRASSLVVHSLS